MKPRIPVNAWGLLLRAVVAIALLDVANKIRVPLHQLAGNSPLVEAALWCLTPVVVVAFVIAWVRWVERSRIDWSGARGLIGGTLIAAVPMVVGWVILAAVQGRGPTIEDAEGVPLVAVVIWILVRSYLLQGIPEELIFRGWLFNVTRHREALTIGWTTAAFTLPHLTSSGGQASALDHILYLTVPLGMSILGAALVYTFGSFWWAAGSHGGMHLMLAVLSLIYPVELNNVTWVVLGLLQVLLGAALLWYRRSRRQAKAPV